MTKISRFVAQANRWRPRSWRPASVRSSSEETGRCCKRARGGWRSQPVRVRTRGVYSAPTQLLASETWNGWLLGSIRSCPAEPSTFPASLAVACETSWDILRRQSRCWARNATMNPTTHLPRLNRMRKSRHCIVTRKHLLRTPFLQPRVHWQLRHRRKLSSALTVSTSYWGLTTSSLVPVRPATCQTTAHLRHLRACWSQPGSIFFKKCRCCEEHRVWTQAPAIFNDLSTRYATVISVSDLEVFWPKPWTRNWSEKAKSSSVVRKILTSKSRGAPPFAIHGRITFVLLNYGRQLVQDIFIFLHSFCSDSTHWA